MLIKTAFICTICNFDSVAFVSVYCQHGETALHLVAKYNHDAVVPVFAAFRVNMDAKGKVRMILHKLF